MPNSSQNNREKKLKDLESLILSCITLKAHEKADILDILPQLTDEHLDTFMQIFQDDAKRSRKLLLRALMADPDFGKKLSKSINEDFQKLTKKIEEEEAKKEEASSLLENL